MQPRTKALCSAERETLAVSKCACISDESNGLLEFCDGAVLALLKANVCVCVCFCCIFFLCLHISWFWLQKCCLLYSTGI